jgi:uncharacterized alkaline shock family protein YloU
MTEREHRTGSGGVKDNVRDELAEAAGYRKEAAPEEEEEQAGSGRVKDTVRVRKLSGGERGAKERNRMSAQTTNNGRHHQQSPLKTERGTTTIQDSVVSQVAGMAAQEVEGIRMGSSTTQTVGSLMSAVPGVGSQSESRGVSVEVGEVEAAVDLSLSVEYGRTIHQIAETVRRNVIRRVEHLVGLRVTEVNITVSDIFFAQQEEQREQ